MKLNEKTSEEKDHATYGASNSERWLNCPRSIRLIEDAPPSRESEAAAEGTKAHACLEFLTKNRKNLVAAIRSARELYDEEMIEHALDALRWAVARQEELPGSTLHSEKKVDSSVFTMAEQFGTLDMSIVQPFGRLVIADFKYGAGVVRNPEGDDGNGDPQLIYYALATSYEHNHNFTDVELVVIQPRAYHESGETIRTHVMTIDELLAWAPKFKAGVKRTLAPDAPTKSGKWCRFCEAAPICPTLKDDAMKRAQIVFSDETGLESTPEVTPFILPRLSQWLDSCDKLEAWIKKVREHALYVLERGGEIEGYKLVPKRGQRKWRDSEKAAADAAKRFGDIAMAEPKALSPAQLEKVAKKHKAYDAFVAKHVVCESSGLTMVDASDKRDPVRPASQVFEAIEAPKAKSKRK